MHIGLSLGINNPVPRTTSGGVTPPLDDYTGAQTAWSVARKLRTAYSGSLIRVRRDSDNAEQDIGFDGNGDLDELALTTFVGAGSGYITTAYDQSGNANNWTQTTSTLQPRIVDTGTIETVNGKPAMWSDPTGNQYNIETGALTGANNSTVFSVIKKTSSTVSTNILSDGSAVTGYYIGNADGDDAVNAVQLSAGMPSYYVNGSLVTPSTRQYFYNAITTNQNIVAITSCDFSLWSAFSTDRKSAASTRATEMMQELIIYNSDKSSDRTAIETNINDYYGIY